jgi:hypothetical protein
MSEKSTACAAGGTEFCMPRSDASPAPRRNELTPRTAAEVEPNRSALSLVSFVVGFLACRTEHPLPVQAGEAAAGVGLEILIAWGEQASDLAGALRPNEPGCGIRARFDRYALRSSTARSRGQGRLRACLVICRGRRDRRVRTRGLGLPLRRGGPCRRLEPPRRRASALRERRRCRRRV